MFIGKVHAHICLLHKATKVTSFTASLLPVKTDQTQISAQYLLSNNSVPSPVMPCTRSVLEFYLPTSAWNV